MFSDLFRYHKSVKIFGVIPLYEVQYTKFNPDREKVSNNAVPEFSDFEESEEDSGPDSLDFWR